MVQILQFQGTTRSREIFVGFGPPTGRQLFFSRGITSEKVEPCTEPRPFRNRAVMSRYADALALASSIGTLPDINQVRYGEQIKYGAGISVEQRVVPRRRRAALPPRTGAGGVLQPAVAQGRDRVAEWPAHRQPGLQRRPRGCEPLGYADSPGVLRAGPADPALAKATPPLRMRGTEQGKLARSERPAPYHRVSFSPALFAFAPGCARSFHARSAGKRWAGAGVWHWAPLAMPATAAVMSMPSCR